MRPYSLLLLFITFGFLANTQPPAITWQYMDGGTFTDYGRMVKTTYDGGYIVAGEYFEYSDDTVHIGKSDFWILKFDINGSLEWEKFYGGTMTDQGYAIWPTSGCGYLVTGTTFSNDVYVTGMHGMRDIWLISLDVDGEFVWQRCYGGSSLDHGRVVFELPNRDIILAGYTDSQDGDITGNHSHRFDYWVLKLDMYGDIIWEKCYGGTDDECLKSLHPTIDGGYIISGTSTSDDGQVMTNYGSRDVWVIKIDGEGNLQWQKTFGGSHWDKAGDAIPTSDGGYLVACAGKSDDGNMPVNYGRTDFWIIKLSAFGAVQWQEVYGGSNYDEPVNAYETPDGDFIISGITDSNDGHVSGLHGIPGYKDIWIIKISSSGELIWQHCYGGSNGDYLHSMVPYNNNFLFSGYTWSDDGDVTGDPDQSDLWVCKLAGTITDQDDTKNESFFQIYPNPNNGYLYMESSLELKDVVITLNSLSGINAIETSFQSNDAGYIDITKLKPGIYLVKVVEKDQLIFSDKIIKL